MLLICPGCGHCKSFAKLNIIHKRFRCLCCDAHAANVVRRRQIWMAALAEREREQARLDTHAGLLWLAHQWHYKPQWAACKFKLLYLFYPSFVLDPRPPYKELMTWILKEKQRYAAQRRKLAGPKPKAGPAVEPASALMGAEDWQIDL